MKLTIDIFLFQIFAPALNEERRFNILWNYEFFLLMNVKTNKFKQKRKLDVLILFTNKLNNKTKINYCISLDNNPLVWITWLWAIFVLRYKNDTHLNSLSHFEVSKIILLHNKRWIPTNKWIKSKLQVALSSLSHEYSNCGDFFHLLPIEKFPSILITFSWITYILLLVLL